MREESFQGSIEAFLRSLIVQNLAWERIDPDGGVKFPVSKGPVFGTIGAWQAILSPSDLP